ncbi:hypothetical protein H7H48_15820 [Nitratireductor sp. B36]|uniref:hypothetical protein n=1 Tax=Nitratireductor sp. B36 TaxID=2762059 RepID=UPI001E5E0D73|nr:hypothetical protein [Nitratireductor sp. B36]MCC5780529.1 hypothetical protein [Nitratireductor sp. B36]
MNLKRIIGVSFAENIDDYHVMVELEEPGGQPFEYNYYLSSMDPHGLAPRLREEVAEWIAQGGQVMPFVPPAAPTPEESRAAMPPLSRRQLLLGLYSISITEAQVDAAIGSDTQSMIEWRDAGSYRRTHPLVSSLAAYFSLTDVEVDSLWLWASEL